MKKALFEIYLAHLRRLVRLPSVFTQPADVGKALACCRKTFQENLAGYNVIYDSSRNLLAIPRHIKANKDLVILSAHMDTVDADPASWDAPYHPFKPFESSREIVARGVSDCKAGVAFQLFLAELAGRGLIQLQNLVFTLTFKEEGAGAKTSTAIGRAVGGRLPVSLENNYLLVLENTLLKASPATLNYYNRERSNFLIEMTAPLADIQSFLKCNRHWNPVSIRPNKAPGQGTWRHRHQLSRHMCRTPRSRNLLYKMLMAEGPHGLLQAGKKNAVGVCPERVSASEAKTSVRHTVVLSNRSFDSVKCVMGQLREIKYKPVKKLGLSAGMDVRKKMAGSRLGNLLPTAGRKDLAVTPACNPGCSDASIIYNSLAPELKNRLIPIVMGPGTRSQPGAAPPRLTHGKNETFDKAAGRKGVACLYGILRGVGILRDGVGKL